MDASPHLDWIRPTANGFHVLPGDFYLDPHRAVAEAVISHAHADHYPRGMGKVHATRATIALARTRYRNLAGKEKSAHDFHAPFRIGDVEVELLPAGHMLGSAQVLLRHKGRTALYTGDFSLQTNPTCQPLARPSEPIDLLIAESTFGEKARHADARESLKAAVAAAGKRHLLIGAYALGKAQHVNRLLNEVAPDMPVLIARDIHRFHLTYETMDARPGTYQIYRRQFVKRAQRPFAHIVPPRALSGYARHYDYYKVFATGWKTSWALKHTDGEMEISDHAAADEIMAYIEDLQPKEVWFWHGFPKNLIAACTALNIQSYAVN